MWDSLSGDSFAMVYALDVWTCLSDFLSDELLLSHLWNVVRLARVLAALLGGTGWVVQLCPHAIRRG